MLSSSFALFNFETNLRAAGIGKKANLFTAIRKILRLNASSRGINDAIIVEHFYLLALSSQPYCK